MDICPDWLMPGCTEKPNWQFDGQMLSTAIKGNSFSELLTIFYLLYNKDTSIVSYSFSYFDVRYRLRQNDFINACLRGLYMYTSRSVETCTLRNNDYKVWN